MGDVRISSYNQQGGITAQNVHVGGPARHLDEDVKRQIREMIPKEQKVVVSAALGDGESFVFAQEIKDYMGAAGYDVDGVNQSVWMPPIKGQAINNQSNPWQINIGHHP
jgi:hypothetical protein